MSIRIMPPVHPGEYLQEELLSPLGLTPYGLAQKLHVPRTRVERLVRRESSITPDTALRLAKFFGMSAEFWMNMQGLFDLTMVEMASTAEIEAIETMRLPEDGDTRRRA